jgi:protease PrsW
MIMVGAGVIPATFVSFIMSRRLPFDVPGGVLSVVAVVGGVTAIIVAGLLEHEVLRQLPTLSVVAIAVSEEAAKLLVPLTILLMGRRYRAPLDGLLIGVASGAGFAVLETMGYAFVTLVNTHGSLTAVDDVLAVRGVLSPAGHMAWTGLTASALWLAAAGGWSRRATGQAVAVYLAALGLHTAWDGIGSTAAYIVIAVIGLGALNVCARLLQQYGITEGQAPKLGSMCIDQTQPVVGNTSLFG